MARPIIREFYGILLVTDVPGIAHRPESQGPQSQHLRSLTAARPEGRASIDILTPPFCLHNMTAAANPFPNECRIHPLNAHGCESLEESHP